MSFLLNVEKDLIGFEKKVLLVLTSETARQDALKAANLVEFAVPIVMEFAASGYLPQNVVTIMQRYAVPVAEGLLNGSITIESEIKLLVGQAASAILSRQHGVTTTIANIARDLAFLQVSHAPTLKSLN